jgi:hypothetical protein
MTHLRHSLNRTIWIINHSHRHFESETKKMTWYTTPDQLQALWHTRVHLKIHPFPDPLHAMGVDKWSVGEYYFASNLLSKSLFMAGMCTTETMSDEGKTNYPGNLERDLKDWRNVSRATMRQLKVMLARWDQVGELLRKLRKMRVKLEIWS